MSEMLSRLEKEPGKAQVLENIDTDPIEAGLLREYIGSIADAQERAELENILVKRLGDDGLMPQENVKLHNHVVRYTERKKKGELVVGNLNDEDVKQLGNILAQNTASTDPQELQLYILGLAVRGGANFDKLGEKVALWKHAARDKVAESKTQKWQKQLDKLSERYGVSKTEIDRFVQINDDGLRLFELKAAIGRSGFMRSMWNSVVQNHPGTNAGALNAAIRALRAESTGVRDGLNQVVAVLASMDTSRDNWWKDIPEAKEILKRRAAENIAAKEKPVTLSEARNMTSEAEVARRVEAELAALDGGNVKTKFEEARRRHIASPDALWQETVDVGGGTMKSYDEIFNGVSSKIESEVQERGLISKLIEILLGPIMKNNFAKARNRLQAAA